VIYPVLFPLTFLLWCFAHDAGKPEDRNASGSNNAELNDTSLSSRDFQFHDS